MLEGYCFFLAGASGAGACVGISRVYRGRDRHVNTPVNRGKSAPKCPPFNELTLWAVRPASLPPEGSPVFRASTGLRPSTSFGLLQRAQSLAHCFYSTSEHSALD
jgi:hypothetical protein